MYTLHVKTTCGHFYSMYFFITTISFASYYYYAKGGF